LQLDSFLRSSNSTVELDSLLEVPSAFREAVDQVSLPEIQELLRHRGRRRQISLEGDHFQPAALVVGERLEFMAPSQESLSLGPMFEMREKSGCWSLTTRTVSLLEYIRVNATFRWLNSTSLQVDFSPIPMMDREDFVSGKRTQSSQSLTTSLLRVMNTRDEWLTIRLAGLCVKGRHEPEPLRMKLLRIPTPSPQSRLATAIRAARNTLYVVQLVTAVNGGGALAISSARSSVVLKLFTCFPDFVDRLDVMDSPFQLSLGSQQYSQYLGASMMNHVLIYGLVALHALIGVIYSCIRCVSVWDGFVWVRFPSLSLLPLQYLIETTAQSATIVASAAVSTLDRGIAGISLCFLVAPAVAMLVYLTGSWGPQFFRGASPMSLNEINSRRNRIGETPLLHCKGVTNSGQVQWFPSARAKLKLIVDSILFFIDGDISWKDSNNCRPGYCRASRLLFMDYTPPVYWFMAVELGVALLMGVLGGIKVGSCDTTAIVTVVVLILFLVTILALHPYNTAFGACFNILVTLLQVLGAAFAVIALSRGGTDLIVYRERSELMCICGFYLLVGKAVLDLLPKFRDLIVYLYRRLGEELGTLTLSKAEKNLKPSSSSFGAQGTHDDLTKKLLQTIQASSAADANWVSSINAASEDRPTPQQPEEDDMMGLLEDNADDLPFPLPPPPELPAVENWGYEWDLTDMTEGATADLPDSDPRELLPHSQQERENWGYEWERPDSKEDAAADLRLLPLPEQHPSLSQQEVENWGYRWDQSDLRLQHPVLKPVFEEDDEVSPLKRLPSRVSRRCRGDEDSSAPTTRGEGQRSRNTSLPLADLSQRDATVRFPCAATPRILADL
jgi:hypothetical protein